MYGIISSVNTIVPPLTPLIYTVIPVSLEFEEKQMFSMGTDVKLLPTVLK